MLGNEEGKFGQVQAKVDHTRSLIQHQHSKARVFDWGCYEDPKVTGKLRFGGSGCTPTYGVGAFVSTQLDNPHVTHPKCGIRFLADSAERCVVVAVIDS